MQGRGGVEQGAGLVCEGGSASGNAPIGPGGHILQPAARSDQGIEFRNQPAHAGRFVRAHESPVIGIPALLQNHERTIPAVKFMIIICPEETRLGLRSENLLRLQHRTVHQFQISIGPTNSRVIPAPGLRACDNPSRCGHRSGQVVEQHLQLAGCLGGSVVGGGIQHHDRKTRSLQRTETPGIVPHTDAPIQVVEHPAGIVNAGVNLLL